MANEDPRAAVQRFLDRVISKGELTKKVILKAQAVSASALAAIQKAGGSFEKVARLARPTNAAKAEKAEKKATAKAALPAAKPKVKRKK